MQFASIIKDDSVTIILNNQTYMVNEDHKNYKEIIKCINEQRYADIEELVNVKKAIESYSNGNIKIVDGQVHYNDKPLHNYVANKLIRMWEQGMNVSPLVKFIERLMQNPSYRAVTELYGFMEKHNLPITEDGHFLAYKKVRPDFKDIHSGTFDNSVGNVLSMERNEVDDNANRTCSNGLHFCGFSYLSHFGSNTEGLYNVVILKIDPADVVAIPTDYNNAKGRTCRYEIIGIHSQGISEHTLTDEVVYSTEHDDDDLDWDESDDTWYDSGCWESSSDFCNE